MMATSISNTDDVIDSRMVIERISELEDEQQDVTAKEWSEMDESDELEELQALAEEGSGFSEWDDGVTMILDSHFEEYAQELAEDCGMIPEGLTWPCDCIDWEKAARELQMDYSSLSFGSSDYWVR